MSRGAVAPRLSAKETLVLELLVTKGEMYGLELVAASDKQLKQGWSTSPSGAWKRKAISPLTSRLRRRRPAVCRGGCMSRRLWVVDPGCLDQTRTPIRGGVRAMRPGTRLRNWARHWFSKTTMDRLIDPMIADLQHEYAATSGRWERRWIR